MTDTPKTDTTPITPSVPARPHPPPPPQPQPQPISTQLSVRPPTAQPTRPPLQPVLYPVASSGRGFIHRITTTTQPIDNVVAAANSAAAYATRGVLPYAPMHFSKQPVVNFQSASPVRGVPMTATNPKAASSSPTTDFTGQRNTRDKRKDDTVAVIRGRQVKITEGASMYSLCQSWMKNGADEESQPPPPPSDVIMTLPKPLPPSTGDTQMSDKKEGEEEQADEKEDEESVEHLSIKDLLKRHVDRAKKVRAEFRQKRLNRIARYKNRLALLLPPMAEPQSNNDASSGSKDAATGNLPPGHD